MPRVESGSAAAASFFAQLGHILTVQPLDECEQLLRTHLQAAFADMGVASPDDVEDRALHAVFGEIRRWREDPDLPLLLKQVMVNGVEQLLHHQVQRYINQAASHESDSDCWEQDLRVLLCGLDECGCTANDYGQGTPLTPPDFHLIVQVIEAVLPDPSQGPMTLLRVSRCLKFVVVTMSVLQHFSVMERDRTTLCDTMAILVHQESDWLAHRLHQAHDRLICSQPLMAQLLLNLADELRRLARMLTWDTSLADLVSDMWYMGLHN